MKRFTPASTKARLLGSVSVMALMAGCGTPAQIAGSLAVSVIDNMGNNVSVGISVKSHNEKMYDWFYSQIGLREGLGALNNDEIVKMHSFTSLGPTDDSVPWCSSALNMASAYAGITGTNSAMARSWEDWGVEVSLTEVVRGDVVVLWRGTPEATTGHVGLVHKVDIERGVVEILGGNQNDEINISTYPLSRIVALRRAA